MNLSRQIRTPRHRDKCWPKTWWEEARTSHLSRLSPWDWIRFGRRLAPGLNASMVGAEEGLYGHRGGPLGVVKQREEAEDAGGLPDAGATDWVGCRQ